MAAAESSPIRIVGALDGGCDGNARHTLRLALAQVLPSDAETAPGEDTTGDQDAADAMDKLKSYAAEAARQGADVVCFPEYFLTGATHSSWKAVRERQEPIAAHPNPEEDESHWLAQVADIARQNDIDIVAGTVVELGAHHIPHRQQQQSQSQSTSKPGRSDDASKGHSAKLQVDTEDRLFNTAYYVDRTGQVAAKYTKRNLWHPERSVLSPGHPSSHPSPRLFEITTKRGLRLKASMLICWDLAMPEAFRELLQPPPDGQGPLLGPDVVFVPTCWYATDAGVKGLRWSRTGEAAVLDSFSMARAIETEAVIAMCNIAGPDWPQNDLNALTLTDTVTDADLPVVGVGHSSVHAPFLGCLGKVEDGKEALLLAEVDTRLLGDARETYRVRYDLVDAVV
ncbi:hypothetical protein OC842_002102 [Tilletia horrida]|uniref:CN hydrolase domain-containing protein n=1 Tax=Tilletia horrida TaxID=155126 RepID=A0AAN6GEB8_9BASI|nr:hypothetical protein OC842_002102 [Tilletia horrida]